MRRADEESEPDPLPRLPREVLALMASVSLRLHEVSVVPPARPAVAKAKAPRPRARRITVAEGWAPRPDPDGIR